MDKLLDKFSLQTFLRQFFCGVVFFVPLWLFGRESLGELSNIQNWQIGTFGLFTALASIIGTIIYHLEKNLWSYPMQWLHERFLLGRTIENNYFKIVEYVVLILWILFFVLFIVLNLVSIDINFLLPACTLILSVCCFLYKVMKYEVREEEVREEEVESDISSLLERTRRSWFLEDNEFIESIKGYVDELKQTKFAQSVAIAKKVAAWSDFIHCVQSCCFAWLLGSCFVFTIEDNYSEKIDWVPCELCGDMCMHVQTKTEEFKICTTDGLCLNSIEERKDDKQGLSIGIAVALLILSIEFVIDRHRYLHVYEMTKFFNEIK